MKVKNLLKITALALFIALPLSCVEPEEPIELPPETQKGANTFGCLVNGELFVAQPSGLSFNSRTYVYADYGVVLDGPSLTIFGSNKKGLINIILHDPETNMLLIPRRLTYRNNNDRFYVFRPNTGEVFLTKFDLENRIVSGTFEFEIPLLKDDETVEDITVKITEGRFDIKF